MQSPDALNLACLRAFVIRKTSHTVNDLFFLGQINASGRSVYLSHKQPFKIRQNSVNCQQYLTVIEILATCTSAEL